MFGVLAIGLVLLGRFVGIGLPVTLLRTVRSFERGTVPVLTWGGLRGSISVALALSLPDVPAKALLVTATYSVVVFSVLVQGLTIAPLFEASVEDAGDESTAPQASAAT